MRRTTIIFGFVACGVIGLAANRIFMREAQVEFVRSVATVKEVHEAMITPASDAIFDAGNNEPEDDTAWMAVRKNAAVLAESGNLLMSQSLARDNGPWMMMSRALVDAAAAALKSAEEKDLDALLASTDQITEACMNCHQPYRDAGRPMLKNPN